MSNAPKKHHFLPQSYLKGFQIGNRNKNPKIFVYEKGKTAFVYPASIKNTACIGNYHTIKVEDINDRSTIETIFSQMEDEIIQNIRAITKSEKIDKQSKITLAITLLFFKSRVPQNLEMFRKFFQRTLEGVAEANFRVNNTDLKGSFNDNFNLTVYNNFPLFMMFNSVFKEERIADLCCRNFSLLKAPKDNYFVCSDAPVSYYVPNYKSGRGVGLLCPDLEIFLPLNSSYGLLCSNNNISELKELTINELNEYNRRTIITAEKYIFGNEINSNIQKLILDNLKEFSGIIYHDFDTIDGRFQYAAYIPVTS